MTATLTTNPKEDFLDRAARRRKALSAAAPTAIPPVAQPTAPVPPLPKRGIVPTEQEEFLGMTPEEIRWSRGEQAKARARYAAAKAPEPTVKPKADSSVGAEPREIAAKPIGDAKSRFLARAARRREMRQPIPSPEIAPPRRPRGGPVSPGGMKQETLRIGPPPKNAEEYMEDAASGIRFYRFGKEWSSVRTTTFTTDTGAINIPTVMPGGYIMKPRAALDYWTENDPSKIEQFPSLEAATAASQAKHLKHQEAFQRASWLATGLEEVPGAAVVEPEPSPRQPISARAPVAPPEVAEPTGLAAPWPKPTKRYVAGAGYGPGMQVEVPPPASAYNDEQAAKQFGVTVEQVKGWRKQGAIGYAEKFGRATATDVGERLPIFGPLFTVRRAAELKTNANILKPYHDELTAYAESARAVAESGVSDIRGVSAEEAVEGYLANYNRVLEAMQATDAAKEMNQYLNDMAEYAIRGETMAATIWTGISAQPAYVGDFLATGGAYAVGKKAVLAGLRQYVKSNLGRLALRTLAAAAGTTLRTGMMAGRVAAGAEERMIPTVQRGEDGRLYVRDSDKAYGIELFRSLVDVWIENFTEVSSGGIARVMKAKFPKMHAFFGKLRSQNKVFTAAGFHGLVGETGEEQLGRFMRWGVGLTGFDMDVDNPIPTFREMLIEIGVLSPMSLISAGAAGVRRLGRPMPEAPPPTAPAVVPPAPAVAPEPTITPEAVPEAPVARPIAPREAIPEEIPTERPPEAAIPAVPAEAVVEPAAAPATKLYHVGVELKPGEKMKTDARGLVWFSTSPTKYGAARPGVPATEITIPEGKMLVIEDAEGRQTAEGKEVIAATENASKQEIFEEAERRGYLAVQRAFDVSMRPETAERLLGAAAPAEAKPEAAPAKQPWEMTRKQYEDQEEKMNRGWELASAAMLGRKPLSQDSGVKRIKIRNPQQGGASIVEPTGRAWSKEEEARLKNALHEQGFGVSKEIVGGVIPPGRGFRLTGNVAEVQHRRSVYAAQRQGKPVSPKVLTDYPDLAKPPAKPVPAVEKPGREARRVISKDRYAQAVQRIKEAQAKAKEKGEAGELDIGTFKEYAMAGAYHVQEGILDFLDWSAKMVEVFGEEVRRHLDRIWASPEVQEAGEGKLKKPPTVRRMKEEFGVAPRLTKAEIRERAGLRRELAKNIRLANAAYAQGEADLGETHQVLLDAIEGQFPERIEMGLRKRILAAKTPGAMRSVSRTIQAKLMRKTIPGTREAEGPPVKTEREVLKAVMRKLEIRAPGIYMAAARDVVAMHGNLAEYAGERLAGLDITEAGRSRLIRRLATARTAREQTVLVAAIEMIAQHAERRAALASLKETLKGLDRKRMDSALGKQVDGILEDLTLKEPASKTLRRAESLLKAAKKEVLRGPATEQLGEIPSRLVARARTVLIEAGDKSLNDLSTDELKDVMRTLQNLAHLNATKNQLKWSRDKRTADEQIAAAIQEVQDRNPARFEPAPGEEGEYLARSIPTAIGEFATWAGVDGRTKVYLVAGPDGVVEEILVRGRNSAEDVALTMVREAKTGLAAARENAGIAVSDFAQWSRLTRGWLKKRIGLKLQKIAILLPTATNEKGQKLTKPLTMTKAELIDLLGLLSDGNRRAEILRNKSEGITFTRNRGRGAVKLRYADVEAIESFAKTNAPDVVAVIDFMKKYLNSKGMRGGINETSRSTLGFDVASRKDHWPSTRDAEYRETDPSKLMHFWVQRHLENQGILKPRTASTAPMMVGDGISKFFTHVNKLAAFVGKARQVQDAMRLLRNRDFRNAIRGRFKHGDMILRDLEARVRRFEGTERANKGAVSRVVNFIKRAAHRGVLALKPHIMGFQAVSLENATEVIPAKYIRAALVKVRPKKARAWIEKNSPRILARIEGSAHQILTPEQQGMGLDEFIGLRKPWLDMIGLGGIHGVDTGAMYVLQTAAEEQAEAEGVASEEATDFIKRQFEDAVDLTQPTWDDMTSSSIAMELREHPGLLLVPGVMFSSMRSTIFNQAVRATSRLNHASKATAGVRAKAWAKYSGEIGRYVLFNALVIQLLREGYFALVAPGDDEKGLLDRAIDSVVGFIGNVFGAWVGPGEIVARVAKAEGQRIKGKPVPHELLRPNLFETGLQETWEGIRHLRDAVDEAFSGETFKRGGQRGTKKWKVSLWRGFRKTMRGMGALTGIPTQGIEMATRRIHPYSKKKPPEKITIKHSPPPRGQ